MSSTPGPTPTAKPSSTTEPPTYTPDIPGEAITRTTSNIHVSLTPHPLNSSTATQFVRSPSAGATVVFIGTTRDSFDSKPVASLAYTSYTPLALNTLYTIAESILENYAREEDDAGNVVDGVAKIAIEHKLGECPVGEESIVIAVSAKHRGAAWRAGEEALEETKRRAEIWKLERFEGGEGVWRANRDGARGERVDDLDEEDKRL